MKAFARWLYITMFSQEILHANRYLQSAVEYARNNLAECDDDQVKLEPLDLVKCGNAQGALEVLNVLNLFEEVRG